MCSSQLKRKLAAFQQTEKPRTIPACPLSTVHSNLLYYFITRRCYAPATINVARGRPLGVASSKTSDLSNKLQFVHAVTGDLFYRILINKTCTLFLPDSLSIAAHKILVWNC